MNYIKIESVEFIISKGGDLPTDIHKMESSEWFNIYATKKMPYKMLMEGDILYWLDTTLNQLKWKSKVVNVERYKYLDKNEIWEKYHDSMTESYFDDKKNIGYFIHYKIKILDSLNIPKPNGYKFDQLGWEILDDFKYREWFNSDRVLETDVTIDDQIIFESESIIRNLIKLNEKMQDVSPERIRKMISVTLRKDTSFINALKKAAGFRCQFPNCGHQIKTKSGDFYIEVAHIEAVKNNGKGVLGNLLVLCPNHHKEFDFGDLKISNNNQSVTEISGTLNGVPFAINLNPY